MVGADQLDHVGDVVDDRPGRSRSRVVLLVETDSLLPGLPGVVRIAVVDLLHLGGDATGQGRLLGIDVTGIEVDLDHPAPRGHGPDHLVRQVPPVVGHPPAGGVGGQERGLRDLERVPEGLVGDVRDVDHHPQPIHLPHD